MKTVYQAKTKGEVEMKSGKKMSPEKKKKILSTIIIIILILAMVLPTVASFL